MVMLMTVAVSVAVSVSFLTVVMTVLFEGTNLNQYDHCTYGNNQTNKLGVHP